MLFLLSFVFVTLFLQPFGEAVDSSFDEYRLCERNNKKPGVESKDCEGKLLSDLSVRSFEELWDAALRVRQEIGNLNSLSFFVKALSKETSEEHCIDRFLEMAVFSGLNLPKHSSPYVKKAQKISFELCEKEIFGLIQERMKANPSNAFIKNVCSGVPESRKKSLDQC